MALIVTIDDQLYLTDVGFGDSFRRPISLREKVTEDVSGKYRIVNYEAYHYRSGRRGKIQEIFEYYILEHSTGKNWKPLYKFHYKAWLLAAQNGDLLAAFNIGKILSRIEEI